MDIQDSKEMSGNSDVETEEFDAMKIRDQDELGVIDEEEDIEREEEIDEVDLEWEDEPKDSELDESDANNESINLGPEDSEKSWEDNMLNLEGYAVL
jgi:hypothetical protein